MQVLSKRGIVARRRALDAGPGKLKKIGQDLKDITVEAILVI